ncbi:hypothetical protein LshimejAT787_1502280 [Lyophyllum shimeji]|uniref:Uncharacterized protein n=1 Tax=Lyophyllum shimeji TaxID=47721 RepID=A0A9P3PYQ6_LYOSH|nr:hypothetical protein LshimejAT787_1502280 [Lyophyllum shimeji]
MGPLLGPHHWFWNVWHPCQALPELLRRCQRDLAQFWSSLGYNWPRDVRERVEAATLNAVRAKLRISGSTDTDDALALYFELIVPTLAHTTSAKRAKLSICDDDLVSQSSRGSNRSGTPTSPCGTSSNSERDATVPFKSIVKRSERRELNKLAPVNVTYRGGDDVRSWLTPAESPTGSHRSHSSANRIRGPKEEDLSLNDADRRGQRDVVGKERRPQRSYEGHENFVHLGRDSGEGKERRERTVQWTEHHVVVRSRVNYRSDSDDEVEKAEVATKYPPLIPVPTNIDAMSMTPPSARAMATSWSSTSQLQLEVMATKSSLLDVMELGSFWAAQRKGIVEVWQLRNPSLSSQRVESILKLADRALSESHEGNQRAAGGTYNVGSVYQGFLRDFTQIYYDRRTVRRSQQGWETSQQVGGPSGGRRGIESANLSVVREAASGSPPLPQATTSTTRPLSEGQAATSGGQSQRISALKLHHGSVTSPSEVVVGIEGCRQGFKSPSAKATLRTPPVEMNDVANEVPLLQDSRAAGGSSSRPKMEETMECSMETNKRGPQDTAEHSAAVQSPAGHMGCVAPLGAHRGPGVWMASKSPGGAPSSACVVESLEESAHRERPRRAATFEPTRQVPANMVGRSRPPSARLGTEPAAAVGREALDHGVLACHGGRANFALKPKGRAAHRPSHGDGR